MGNCWWEIFGRKLLSGAHPCPWPQTFFHNSCHPWVQLGKTLQCLSLSKFWCSMLWPPATLSLGPLSAFYSADHSADQTPNGFFTIFILSILLKKLNLIWQTKYQIVFHNLHFFKSFKEIKSYLTDQTPNGFSQSSFYQKF